MKSQISKFRPAVRKSILVLLSGIVWLGTGFMLISLALGWIRNSDNDNVIWFAIVGIVAALLIHRYGFLRIVDKNLRRIRKIEGLYCAFGFMPWKSYFLVASMMALGMILKSSSMSKEYLSIIYIGIGMALALSSIRYFVNVWKV